MKNQNVSDIAGRQLPNIKSKFLWCDVRVVMNTYISFISIRIDVGRKVWM